MASLYTPRGVAVTVTVTVVVRVTPPFEAVIVTMYVPGVVRSDADTTNVAEFVPLD